MPLKCQELVGGNATIRSLTNINVVVGRNGSGKSRLLRTLDENLGEKAGFNVRYISPERAGVFQREGSTTTNIERDANWLSSVRRKNQASNFKQASAYLLRELEVVYNRRVLATPALRVDPARSFQNDILVRISGLLPNVSLEQSQSSFDLVSASGQKIGPDELSSGESECIALATEVLYFFETMDSKRFNVLLLDEPDVHLHPDLQTRFAQFVVDCFDALTSEGRDNVALCIATHSTPLICAMAPSGYTSIGTKHFQLDVVDQVSASEQLMKVAPFFGHPLSLCISQDVALILEGEDDERVWQQAARSSRGRINVFPVMATSVDRQSELESFCSVLLSSIYDNPIAYSLRDGDGVRGAVSAQGVVRRFRLQCYEIENALLTDEVLAVLGVTWEAFKSAATRWLSENPDHKDVALVGRLTRSSDRLRDVKIKPIRQLICSIADSKKPWEVVVGQAIGALDLRTAEETPTSLLSYIGVEAAGKLLQKSMQPASATEV